MHLICSESIEKPLLINIFEECYDNPSNFENFLFCYKSQNKIEENIKVVFDFIFKFLGNKLKNQTDVLDFADLLLRQVSVILIETTVSNSAVFNMFEAINSKGKHLEDIDLIKTFVFSQLDERDYDQYLKKWGLLIKETDDQLEDYLWVYVKAFIKYYKYSIKVKSFKTMINDASTFSKFNTQKTSDIIKALIDDLVSKVLYYKALCNIDDFTKIVNQKGVLLQYNIFTELKYEHPRPILLKALFEYDNSDKEKNDNKNLEEILKCLNSYMIIFQTLNKRDSKDSIPLIEEILSELYKQEKIEFKYIKKIVVSKLLRENQDFQNIKMRFKEIEGYKKTATDVGFVMLVLNQAYNSDENFFSQDLANALFKIKNDLVVDHMLPQKPDINSNFKYFVETNIVGDEILKLKPGADFPEEIRDGMPYDDFKVQVLNKMGNLRILFRDENSKRRNSEINLDDKTQFLTYQQIQNRLNDMFNNITKSNMILMPEKVNYNASNNDEEYFILDYNNIDEVTNKKPRLVKIFEKNYEVRTNKDLVKIILGTLHNKKPEILNNLNARNNCNIHPMIKQDSKQLTRPEKIENSSFYFEANRSAVDLIKFIKNVMENLYEYDIKNIEIIYQK